MSPATTSTMKALGTASYGPLDRLGEDSAPLPAPSSGELRVRVIASALNPADYKVILGTLKFLHARNKPLVMGYDFSGVVDALGPSVTGFAVGDEVFGFLPYSPTNRRGAFAEFLVARCDEIARKPPAVSHLMAAAAATTGVTTLQAARDLGRLPPKDGRALLTGVSGGVGSLGVAILRRLDAEVTAVGSGKGLEAARRMGANEIWDRTARQLPGKIDAPFDVIFDAAAAYRWRDWRGALKPGGAFVSTLPSLGYLSDKFSSAFSSTRVHFVTVKSRPKDLDWLASWLEKGLEVPLTETIPVKDIARGLERLLRIGGRIAVQVDGGF